MAKSILLPYLEERNEFAKWVAKCVFEDEWEECPSFYAEIICRKLEKLGLVLREKENYILPYEDNENESDY